MDGGWVSHSTFFLYSICFEAAGQLIVFANLCESRPEDVGIFCCFEQNLLCDQSRVILSQPGRLRQKLQ